MRLVKIERTNTGYFLDPTAYLDRLSEIRVQLPTGAASFAADPSHYDFYSPRCIKDLKLSHISVADDNDRVALEIRFAPNEFRHHSGLLIQYEDVRFFSIEVTSDPRTDHIWPDARRLGDLQLDEILPNDAGCSHEIQMSGGSIRITCADLLAKWATEQAESMSPRSDNDDAR